MSSSSSSVPQPNDHKFAALARPDGQLEHGFVSLRAAATDSGGNTAEVTIIQTCWYDERG